MNYKAELRGFALDRATRVLEIAAKGEGVIDRLKGEDVTIEAAIGAADKIVDYLYIPEKDIQELVDTLVPLLVQSGDIDKLDTFILELQQLRAEMAAKIVNPAAPIAEVPVSEVIA